jgi:hypothetical protein
MKRFIAMLGILTALVTVTACSTGGSAATSAGPDNSKKVYFVRAKEGGGEGPIINRLKKQGYSVYDVADQQFNPEQAKDYGLIYIGPAVNSNRIDPKLKQTTVPVVVSKTQLAGLLGMGSAPQFGDSTGIKTIALQDPKHPLAGGMKETVAIYKEDGKVEYSRSPGKEAILIAQNPVNGNDNKQHTIFAYEKGSKNVNGETVPARQVFFSLPAGQELNLTDNGWTLFDAAIQWASQNGKK